MVIFLFDLEALFTSRSRAQWCAVCPLPRTVGCYWLLCLSNQFPLAATEIKLVYYSILSTMWALGKSCLSTCRHINSLAQSSYIMSSVGAALVRPLRDCDDEAGYTQTPASCQIVQNVPSLTHPRAVHTQEAKYIECWPCPPFHIFLDKCFPAGYPSAGTGTVTPV
jgi:hypothetical protein